MNTMLQSQIEKENRREKKGYLETTKVKVFLHSFYIKNYPTFDAISLQTTWEKPSKLQAIAG